MSAVKPLAQKSYTSIQHLPGSHVSCGDQILNAGQARILTQKSRPGDLILVQEKVDGTNVAVANIDGEIVPLIRAGYRAIESNWPNHRVFAAWAYERQEIFAGILQPGERLCGEWLAQAHSIRYDLGERSPFIAFDLMVKHRRFTLEELQLRWTLTHWCSRAIPLVTTFHAGPPFDPWDAVHKMGMGFYGAKDLPEGVVYRCERNGEVEFLGKFVRPGFVPGKYLSGEPVMNWNYVPETNS